MKHVGCGKIIGKSFAFAIDEQEKLAKLVEMKLCSIPSYLDEIHKTFSQNISKLFSHMYVEMVSLWWHS